MSKQHIVIGDIANSRSGDKGNDANIALFAHSEEGYHQLMLGLTEEKMLSLLKPLGAKSVLRYPVPNLLAINYVVKDVLDGGGSLSLRTDSQGKALGQAIFYKLLKSR